MSSDFGVPVGCPWPHARSAVEAMLGSGPVRAGFVGQPCSKFTMDDVGDIFQVKILAWCLP